MDTKHTKRNTAIEQYRPYTQTTLIQYTIYMKTIQNNKQYKPFKQNTETQYTIYISKQYKTIQLNKTLQAIQTNHIKTIYSQYANNTQQQNKMKKYKNHNKQHKSSIQFISKAVHNNENNKTRKII